MQGDYIVAGVEGCHVGHDDLHVFPPGFGQTSWQGRPAELPAGSPLGTQRSHRLHSTASLWALTSIARRLGAVLEHHDMPRPGCLNEHDFRDTTGNWVLRRTII